MIVIETELKAFLVANARPYDENALKVNSLYISKGKNDIIIINLTDSKKQRTD